MMRRARRIVILGLCAAAGTSSVVRPASAESNADANVSIDTARDLFYRALKLQDQGKWSRALELLEQVAAVRESPQVRFNIAFNQEHLGRLADAVNGYERAIRLAERAGAVDVTSAARRRLAKLARRVGRFVFDVSPDATAIRVDGVELAPQSLGVPLAVSAGEHTIEATAPGYHGVRIRLDVSGGETRDVTLALEPLPAPALQEPPPPAVRAREPLPVREPSVVPSRPIPAARPARTPSTLPYVAGGAAVVALATAGVFYALRQDALDTLQSRCDGARCPDSLRSTDERGASYTLLGNVAFAVGATLAGVSAGLFVLDAARPGPQARSAGSGLVATLGGDF